MKSKIVIKTWLGFLTVFVVIMIVLGGVLAWLSSKIYFKHQVGDLINHGSNWGQLVSDGRDLAKVQETMKLMGNLLAYDFEVVDSTGKILLSTSEKHMPPGTILNYPELVSVFKGEVVAGKSEVNGQGKTLTIFVPYRQGGVITGAVVIHSPMQAMDNAIASVQQAIYIAIILAVAITSILALYVSARLSKPLIEMNKVAQAMTTGDFSQRVNITEPLDELGMLGRTLNKLSGELNDSIMALDGEREQLSNIIQSMTDGVVSFDDKGRVLLSNANAVRSIENPGNLDLESVKDFGPWGEELFAKVMTENKAGQISLQGGDSVFLVKMAPLAGRSQPRGAVALIQDITREHQVELMRREFVATVSHELRSPLGLIQGYTEALRDGIAVSEAVKAQYIGIILDETNRLNRMISDLLDLSGLELKQAIEKPSEFNLEQVVERVVSRFQYAAREKGIDLATDYGADNPAVMGDEDRLEQVLVNFLDNAMRHTPAGGVIAVRTHKQGNSVTVSVTDSGEGINPTDLPYVWNRFYKADKARTRGKGGTGLGLFIVKRIIEAHRGEVWVESSLGKGASFGFKLPLIPRNG